MPFVLFAAMFFAGEGFGMIQERAIPTGLFYNATSDWGLGFTESGKQPNGNESVDNMRQYDAYYMADETSKKIYLTFDCGYENGNTPAILDALKKHNAPATFFVVGHYLTSAPDMVKRMVSEGHTIGNHTYHHPDMSEITDKESFANELALTAQEYKNLIGSDMPMYYRPPQGKYNADNLIMAKELGYKTFFWSLAYADWNQDSQPDAASSLKKLTERIHPGAIVLLHNTSSTNAQILDELLTTWEGMGYSFGRLEEFVDNNEMFHSMNQ
ncbi:MAG: delta-lactam-biosynthetic de-N-acetylase [Lachnospiraceae bacterium]|nr:delta-lactam-biosynthetic de-N-acetylase [Lachnospiraceae bacterium]